MRWLVLTITASVCALLPWRVIGFALGYRSARRENPHMFDPKLALAAVIASIEQDGY